jgi:hypothetical protein
MDLSATTAPTWPTLLVYGTCLNPVTLYGNLDLNGESREVNPERSQKNHGRFYNNLNESQVS